jgi:hypothetical protein
MFEPSKISKGRAAADPPRRTLGAIPIPEGFDPDATRRVLASLSRMDFAG